MSRGPDLARREVWRRRLREFDRGEDTVAEFCRRASVSVASFYQWRRRLSTVVPAEGSTSRMPATAMNFLPVEITPALQLDPYASFQGIMQPEQRKLFSSRPLSEHVSPCWRGEKNEVISIVGKDLGILLDG